MNYQGSVGFVALEMIIVCDDVFSTQQPVMELSLLSAVMTQSWRYHSLINIYVKVYDYVWDLTTLFWSITNLKRINNIK